MWLGEAKTPAGMRLYAIGDVHGCDGLLAEMHARIGADLLAHPVADHRIIHVGDYVDRGPDSAGVIARLSRLCADDPHVVCLRGNHDEMMADFLADPLQNGPVWLSNGAGATLRSYGVSPGRGWFRPAEDLEVLGETLEAKLPPVHSAFLHSLGYSATFGDFFFCHAGIRPGIPLDEQSPYDLIWIRDEFLSDDSDHGVVVVHGHTPADAPEVRRNRINIDTGAVMGGRLTCVVLDGTDHRFL